MCTLLLVEDDLDFAEGLRIYLSAQGFEVIHTVAARHAIDLAARLRPELMLTDWMLRDGVDGIRILEALRAIECMPRTVIMTGLGCDDVFADARRLGVLDVVSKPVAAEKLCSLLRAARKIDYSKPVGSLAMLEVGPTGELLYVNSRATYMFDRVGIFSTPSYLSDLFAPDVQPDLQAAETRWVAAPPAAPSPMYWHMRAQSPRVTGSRIVLLLEANEPHYCQQELMGLILGYKLGTPSISGRVLVIDRSEKSRRLAHRMLTSGGIGCCTADSPARAMRILEQDPGIRVIILDLDAPHAAASFMEQARQRRDSLTFVGALARPDQDHSESGVRLVLSKPWTLTSLLELLEE